MCQIKEVREKNNKEREREKIKSEPFSCDFPNELYKKKSNNESIYRSKAKQNRMLDKLTFKMIEYRLILKYSILIDPKTT